MNLQIMHQVEIKIYDNLKLQMIPALIENQNVSYDRFLFIETGEKLKPELIERLIDWKLGKLKTLP